jgi:hypothetical protein
MAVLELVQQGRVPNCRHADFPKLTTCKTRIYFSLSSDGMELLLSFFSPFFG